jgi:hypothetical protein
MVRRWRLIGYFPILCNPSSPDSADDRSSGEFLRESLREQLRPGGGGFRFELMAQRQTDACRQPLEDARVAWPTVR